MQINHDSFFKELKTVIPDISVVIVSFNTRDLLRDCLLTLFRESGEISYEVFVIDNASKDDSATMVEQEFPHVKLIRSEVNLGFAAANNLGFVHAAGRYIILLNSDAFLTPSALSKAVTYMDNDPQIGIGGARLIGRDGAWQPSARMFPNLLNDFLTLSGLATKYPKSRFFGRVDRTWADPNQAAIVDWVPGAFSIIRRSVLEKIGYFDEQFFLYYEEVDLCRRVQAAGYTIWYWPDVVVVHLGGESSKTLTDLKMSTTGKQITLWQMRSALLFYRKHHGLLGAWLWAQLHHLWHGLRAWKNVRRDQEKYRSSVFLRKLLNQAWQETEGGHLSPPRPWS